MADFFGYFKENFLRPHSFGKNCIEVLKLADKLEISRFDFEFELESWAIKLFFKEGR